MPNDPAPSAALIREAQEARREAAIALDRAAALARRIAASTPPWLAAGPVTAGPRPRPDFAPHAL